MEFLDREKELSKLRKALAREYPQFIVIYGRRRIGKSTLLRKLLDSSKGDIYFLADRTSEPSQRQLFADIIGLHIKGFNAVTYPNWEILLTNLSKFAGSRITVCLDEFPYLVQSCPSLPSVLQKLIDSKELSFNLVICGSSQHMMQGYVLDGNEPLYGRADEIIKLQPIPAKYIQQGIHCNNEQAVAEYAVWGGIPRYWELRNNYPNFYDAIENLLLNSNGTLYDEPFRLLQDEMRDTVQASSILSFIGNGANKLSEIASRAEKQSSDITAQLSRLKNLGLIEKEIPFGENEKSSKKGLYHITDPLLRFHYKYVLPFRSILEMDNSQFVLEKFKQEEQQYVSMMWEELCRNYVTARTLEDIPYQKAVRWWGVYFDEVQQKYLPAELDVVAESFDNKHVLIGECKWKNNVDVHYEIERLKKISNGLSFAKNHQVHLALFLKKHPDISPDVTIITPEDVMD
ncbi:MAG: ATP-binding protein [Prevotella sp.]|nr:ATP-binding protein [Prevotella sp.]